MRGRAAALLFALGGCISEPSYEGRICDEIATCPEDLYCIEGRCSLLAPADDAGENVTDAAVLADGSTVIDAGGTRDATVHADAAVLPDAAGFPDAATFPDAAADSGVPPCVPSQERCNSIDDDCDRVIDNGCPTGAVNFVAPYDTALTGWLPFGDTWAGQGCALGDVVVGFFGHFEEFVNEVGEYCATPVILENTSVTPHTYSLSLAPAPSASPRGGVMGTMYNASCPPGTMVVELSGRSGNWIDQLSFTCAEFELVDTPQPNGTRRFEIREVSGTRAQVTFQAGGAGGVAFSLPCPTDLASTVRLRGALGSTTCCPTLVTTLGLACSELAVGLR